MKRCLPLLLLLLLAPTSWAQEKKEAPAKPREPGLYATLDTSMGKIVIRLFEKESPKTVANFVELATGKKQWRDHGTGRVVTGEPFYNGVLFHRVVPKFMVQTGSYVGDGARVSATIRDEFSPGLKFDRPGRVAMANAGPNTGSSQFFITHGPTPHLDGLHTIFGQVVEGQDVVVAIGNVPRNSNDWPNTPVTINKVTRERGGPGGAKTQ